jgi:tetratricopeptide (TPR) repeat protein
LLHSIAPVAFRWPARFLFPVRSFILALATFAAGAAAFADDPVKQRLDRAVDFLEARIKSDPEDFIALNRLCDALLRRSRWTGQLDDWRRASKLAERSLSAVPEDLNPAGLAVSAQVAMGGHRFAEARDFAQRLAAVTPGKTLPVQILGDASLEMGNLDEAAKAFEQLEELAGAEIGVESRSARLAWMRGKIDESAEHLANALTLAREQNDPETLVWALVQSGEHAFRRGKFDVAEKHYVEALKNAPGYWAALDHMAELRGAQGKDDEAIALFTKAAEASGRPEIWQALGDFHLFKRRNEEAKSAHDRALAGYQASIELGETLYVHHLAGFYSDSRENAEEAVKWARRDIEARKSGYAWDSLAWALSKSGDTAGALDAARKTIATGLADPHVLQHAGMIFLSAGEVPEGQRLLKRCAEVNPHFTGFHVHR